MSPRFSCDVVAGRHWRRNYIAGNVRPFGALLVACLTVVGATVVPAQSASAASFVVDTLSDNPAAGFTLREAIQAANLAAGADTITFAPGLTGTIELTGQLNILASVTINGPGADELTVDANGLGRAFRSVAAGTSLSMRGMEVTGGDTAGPGGGIVFQNGNSLTLYDVRVVTNRATEGGGLNVSNIAGSLTLDTVSISDNTATTGPGGGIGVDDVAGDVAMTDVDMTGNESIASNGGGAFFEAVGGNVQLVSVVVANNVADQDVGGILVDAVGSVGAAYLQIYENAATEGDHGGVHFVSGGDVSITRSSINSNSGGSFGGLAVAATNDVTISTSDVSDNEAVGLHAGAYITGSAVVVGDSRFGNNTSTAPFGGLSVDADTVEIERTTISDNTASIRPGLSMFSLGDVTVSASTINGNSGGGAGAGVEVVSTNDDLTIINSTISGNSTTGTGGAISANGTDVLLRHSTVVGNTAGGASGIFHSIGGATIAYDHSIVAGNTGTMYDDASPATSSASYSLVQSSPGVVVAQNNSLFGVDPELGPLGYTVGSATSTHIPTPTSPVIDAGDPAVVAPPFDQRGLDRFVGAIDIGSVERQVSDSPVWLPVTPARLVETRPGFDTIDGKNEAIGRRAAGATLEFDAAGRAGVPNDARAVIVNITGIDAPTRGYLTAHPCLATRPNASSLNFPADIRVGNEVIAELDDDGHMCIFTYVATHLTVDVTGYVPAESPYVPVAPARLADTRPGFDTIDGIAEGGGRPGAGNTLTLQVAGRGDVPIGASAVVINATAVDAATNGYITVHPCVATPPNASSLNHIGGVNRGNEIVARLNATGKLCIFTKSNIHVTIDVVGYLPPDTDYTPLPAPVRLLDTRPGFSTIDGQFQGGGPRPAGSTLTLDIRSRAGIPDEITSVALNLTAVGATANGYATVFACNGPRPNASSLNFRAGINGGNEIIAGLSPTGKVCIYTHRATHLTVDVAGYTTLES